MQTNVSVSDGKITGTLKYYDTPGAIVDVWGAGNFLVLKFGADDWSDYTSVKVGLEPSYGSGLVEVKDDPDKNGHFKITDKDAQLFKVVCKNATTETVKTYSLNGLVLESDEA